jgi:hypothetical protein
LLFIALTAIGIRLNVLRTRAGKPIKMRKIAAIDALEDAVGRAAELGKPVHFNPGWYTLDSEEASQTVAALSVLSHLVRLCAKSNVDIIVTLIRPDIIPLVDDIIRSGATAEGRPEIYKPENIRYISGEQFAYYGGVAGIFAQERPAVQILMGGFMAYSLLLAELGARYNAFQIAGTASWHQTPFFVATCDYALIGEELYAAGAYLSKDVVALGSLLGQDLCKFVSVTLIIIGVVLTVLNLPWLVNLLKM